MLALVLLVEDYSNLRGFLRSRFAEEDVVRRVDA